MSTMTHCQSRCDEVSARVAASLFRNALAFSLWVLMVLAVMAFSPITGILICAAAFPFALIMTGLSAVLAAAGRIATGTAWLVCVVAAWGLTAPLLGWYENALDRMDPSVVLPGPVEFYWQTWPWAVPAAVIHAVVGICCYRRASRTAA